MPHDISNAQQALEPALHTALQELVNVFAVAEILPLMDTQHRAEISELGKRVGYGAMMTTAQALWREQLYAEGYPVGGEFVSAPCYATAVAALKKARDALGAHPQQGQPTTTLHGMIAAIYGSLDAEDCAMVDREWAKMRGYILPTGGSSRLQEEGK